MGITKKVFPPYPIRGGNSTSDASTDVITNCLSEQLNITK